MKISVVVVQCQTMLKETDNYHPLSKYHSNIEEGLCVSAGCIKTESSTLACLFQIKETEPTTLQRGST